MSVPESLTPGPASGPLLCWTWYQPKQGSLATIIRPDGSVQQGRQHTKDDDIFFTPLGKVSPQDAAQWIARACELAPPASGSDKFGPDDGECVEVRVRDDAGNAATEKALRVKTADLSRNPGMAAYRQQMIAARKQASGGFIAWNSMAARLLLVFGFVIVGLLWLLVKDSRESNRMEASAERIEAKVLKREGETGYDKNKFIQVRYTPRDGQSRESKISDYLSAENWTAAEPGSMVRIWYDPKEQKAFVEQDMERWQKSKKWIFLFPLGLGVIGIGACLLTKGYRVGVHSDGQEYLTRDDRVVTDDKDLPISRTTINVSRLLIGWTRG